MPVIHDAALRKNPAQAAGCLPAVETGGTSFQNTPKHSEEAPRKPPEKPVIGLVTPGFLQ
jgi:hypothetical protein